MKIILLHDVAKIGRRYAVIEVPDGFARNKLIPSRAAVPATPENLKRYTAITSHAEQVKVQTEQQLATHLKQLADTTLTLHATANAKGHLYEAITKEMIAEATVTAGAGIHASYMTIATPIKDVGVHHVTVGNGKVKGEIVVEVLAK